MLGQRDAATHHLTGWVRQSRGRASGGPPAEVAEPPPLYAEWVVNALRTASVRILIAQLDVTAPFIVNAGDVLLCTMRVVGRCFLLRPDPELVQAVEYVVMHYAKKYGIRVHALIVMSSHIHIVYSDVLGNGPKFRRDVDAMIGKFVGRLRNWRGTVLCEPNKVRVHVPFGMLDKMAYTIVNAKTSGVVDDFRTWRGLISTPERIGAPARTVERPEMFFDEDGDMPDEVESVFTFPYATLGPTHSDKDAKRTLGECIARHVRDATRRQKESGHKLLGVEKAMRRKPRDFARGYEEYGAIVPRFSTLGGGREAYYAAVEELHHFLAAYAKALGEWRAGNRDVFFPFGTYKMRVLHTANCHSGP